MNASQMNVDEILFQSGLRINNSLSDPLILNAVSLMGYNQEKLLEGQNLLDEATTLVETQKREYGEVDAAQQVFDNQRTNAHKVYMAVLAISKIAFKGDVQAISTLDLTGRRASTFSGWLNQTRSFYRAILANEAWKTELAKYGQTEAMLTGELAMIDAVATASENKKKEMGDAQNATQERDEKMEELAEWVTDYEVIARIALADKPQLLEKLGIVVKG
ncbi:hypothetical protein SAMN05444285_101249 [Draconibacterium orientale]|uniref:Uncharacterized protein n=1 Tax=Draconibacterium orientale TaxID=1168034 RepID=X5E6C9_9BACT|nr:hypothetical protein [Draconibacterium orientale]AHW62196.1 hypothetical protein FH5T_17120 [Draconibacterium orientale]SES70352.1 hypothetical protein SAMN05444285_101249 [Draconibacterium orientale]